MTPTKIKILVRTALLLLIPIFSLRGQVFAGAAGGIATLSADGSSALTSANPAVSLYKPENGPALTPFAGAHLNEFLSIQGSYIWNRNRLALTSSTPLGFYEQERSSRQDAVIADLLLYFRNRRSWARPYLSAGAGIVRVSSGATRVRHQGGTLPLPAEQFTSSKPAIRVAVGIDLKAGAGWAFRYSFSEAIRANPFSEQLTPPATRGLANFQNLFGVLRTF